MALSYDGVDDLVDHGDIAAIDGASALTVMVWHLFTTTTASDNIFLKLSGTTGMACQLNAANNGYRIYVDPALGDSTGGTPSNGVWRHLAWVFDGSGAANADRAKIYLDGANQTLAFTGTIPTTIPNSGAVSFITGRTVNALDGSMGLLKVWAAALTAAEVQQEMNSYRPARTTNLLIWSPYDDGTSARDYSGAGNHGTVTGALQAAGLPVGYGASLLVG